MDTYAISRSTGRVDLGTPTRGIVMVASGHFTTTSVRVLRSNG